MLTVGIQAEDVLIRLMCELPIETLAGPSHVHGLGRLNFECWSLLSQETCHTIYLDLSLLYLILRCLQSVYLGCNPVSDYVSEMDTGNLELTDSSRLRDDFP